MCIRCHRCSLSSGLGGCNTKVGGHGKGETRKRKKGGEKERRTRDRVRMGVSEGRKM